MGVGHDYYLRSLLGKQGGDHTGRLDVSEQELEGLRDLVVELESKLRLARGALFALKQINWEDEPHEDVEQLISDALIRIDGLYVMEKPAET